MHFAIFLIPQVLKGKFSIHMYINNNWSGLVKKNIYFVAICLYMYIFSSNVEGFQRFELVSDFFSGCDWKCNLSGDYFNAYFHQTTSSFSQKFQMSSEHHSTSVIQISCFGMVCKWLCALLWDTLIRQ